MESEKPMDELLGQTVLDIVSGREGVAKWKREHMSGYVEYEVAFAALHEGGRRTEISPVLEGVPASRLKLMNV